MRQKQDFSFKFRLAVHTAQLQGSRDRQEDALAAPDYDRGVFVVLADGLGGHKDGDRASQSAVHAVVEGAKELFKPGRRINGKDLRKLFLSAHTAVRSIQSWRDKRPAGSTLVMAVFDAKQGRLLAASVGDSPAYLMRDGTLRRLFNPAMDGPPNSETEGLGMPYSIGLGLGHPIGSAVQVMDKALDLAVGDRILLASDGIDGFSTDEVVSCLSFGSSRECCDSLVRKVLEKADPHQDNFTVATVSVDRM